MAHAAQLEFINTISKHLPGYFNTVKVLEIGSSDINGSIRRFFNECEYTGIDVGAGPGVDIVCQGQEFDMPDGHYDHVISCECMEHNPYWKETFLNMVRLCRPGGLVTMTCASIGRDEHGTTRTDVESSQFTVDIGWQYYKNLSENMFRAGIDIEGHFALSRFWCNWRRSDLYFAGIKKAGSIPADINKNWAEFVADNDGIIDAYNAPVRSKLRRYTGTVRGDFGLGLAKKLK